MERENFKSKLGFILVSAGCAIGIGNVWRFPFVTGQNGGGIFVLLYLLFLVIMGIPVLTMELAIGRASKKSAVLAYKKLEKPKSKWHIHGWFCILGCYLLMMYYTPVSGWMLSYFFKFATGTFESGMTAEQVGNVFSNLMSNPVEMIIWMAVMAIAGFFVCSKGIQNGIEKVSKVMMILLLALIVILAINSLTLSGAAEGIKFYLVPDLEKVQSIGIGHIITSAMSQAFFTLSLGIASMEILGSYMTREKTLPSESIKICILDTFVAITAGLIIFPACFSYGVEPNQGPALIFVTLPNVFVSIDMFNMSRTKSVIINAIIMLIGCLPCIFGFNLLSGFNILGKGVLDIEDFAVSYILLPVGAFLYSLFCSTKFGWGFDGYLNECNQGEGIKFPRFFKPYIKYVLPVLVLIVFISGFIPQG